MDEEEVEQLIGELRAMLRETGFGWAGEQAEAALQPDTSRYWIARALIEAAEAVTVDLARIEVTAIRILGVKEIVFKRDLGADGDDRGEGGDGDRSSTQTIASEDFGDGDWFRGPQRLGLLEEMQNFASAFADLKGRLDGIV